MPNNQQPQNERQNQQNDVRNAPQRDEKQASQRDEKSASPSKYDKDSQDKNGSPQDTRQANRSGM